MSALTFQDALNILRLIDAGPFQDLEIEFEGTRLKVSRRTGPAEGAKAALTPPAEPAPTSVGEVHGFIRKVDDEQTLARGASARHGPVNPIDGIEVKPPMAGTYYIAPAPGAAPFVEIGRAVKKADQLGIVEVMKLFTSVLSPCDGIVRAILVRNEQFVERDQTLMIIEAVDDASGALPVTCVREKGQSN